MRLNLNKPVRCKSVAAVVVSRRPKQNERLECSREATPLPDSLTGKGRLFRRACFALLEFGRKMMFRHSKRYEDSQNDLTDALLHAQDSACDCHRAKHVSVES